MNNSEHKRLINKRKKNYTLRGALLIIFLLHIRVIDIKEWVQNMSVLTKQSVTCWSWKEKLSLSMPLFLVESLIQGREPNQKEPVLEPEPESKPFLNDNKNRNRNNIKD